MAGKEKGKTMMDCDGDMAHATIERTNSLTLLRRIRDGIVDNLLNEAKPDEDSDLPDDIDEACRAGCGWEKCLDKIQAWFLRGGFRHMEQFVVLRRCIQKISRLEREAMKR